MRNKTKSLSFKGKKGIALIFCLYFLILLAGFLSAGFIRVIGEIRGSLRARSQIAALYNAEAGLAYGYAELANNNFSWFTMDQSGTPTNDDPSITGASVNGGIYEVTGKHFAVKIFPEYRIPNNGSESLPTGVIIIRSQGSSGGINRTLEYRVGSESAYQYFFFFPDNYTFGNGIWDGRNFGRIHVNGNIILNGSPQLRFLTQLTAGSEDENKGYILWQRTNRFSSAYGNIDYPAQPATARDVEYYYPWLVKTNMVQFADGSWKIRSGEIEDFEEVIGPRYFTGTDAEWDYLKYDGNTNQTRTARVIISDSDLKNNAIYEKNFESGTSASTNIRMFADNPISITINGTPQSFASEKAAFDAAYNLELSSAATVNWTQFWNDWKTNHANDYSSYRGTTIRDDGRDWERRYWWAVDTHPKTSDNTLKYTDTNYIFWGDANNDGMPDGVNREWWEDMEYGNDRASLVSTSGMAPAAIYDFYTGLPTDSYRLNTQFQAGTWANWLEDSDLNEAGENKTLVKDKSQGGVSVDIGSTLANLNIDDDGSVSNSLKQKAINGGIYIDKNTNPISDCVQQKNFYNVYHTARTAANKYASSNVLEIDVNALNQKIASGELSSFNGIVYVDLKNFGWETASIDTKSDSIMLVNAEVLPEQGLSVITPNNVIIKGNYNLDPVGVEEKNRNADSSTVISAAIAKKDYLDSAEDLVWRPSEIITTRAVYTISDEFPEPQYMPMANHIYEEYSEEHSGNPANYDYAPSYYGKPYAVWMPGTGSTTTPDIIDTYFTKSGVERPDTWSEAWLISHWGTVNVWDEPGYFTYTEDGTTKQLSYKEMKYWVYTTANAYYRNYFKYSARETNGFDSTDPSFTNTVPSAYIYNTAVITPYSTDTYPLEYWSKKDRIINGAFIKLPSKYAADIPAESAKLHEREGCPDCCKVNDPTKTFAYESRFGAGSSTSDRPNTGLTFGADSSWREISSF